MGAAKEYDYISRKNWLGYFGLCLSCGATVSRYAASPELAQSRPSAKTYTQWAACDRLTCSNRKGEAVGATKAVWYVAFPTKEVRAGALKSA